MRGQKFTLNDFLNKSKSIHGDLYDYSKTNYINCHESVIIICAIHGEFLQKPTEHFKGSGCKQCGITRQKKSLSLTNEDFIKKSNNIHNYLYDYTKCNYENNLTKVVIICPKHGDFLQVANDHLRGAGCKKCIYENYKIISENKRKYIISNIKNYKSNFIKKAQEKYGELYNYSQIEYVNNLTNINIWCNAHNLFFITYPKLHLKNSGCHKCEFEKRSKLKSNTEEFINKIINVYGLKYDYSLVNFNGNKNYINVICYSHGEFKILPNSHLRGHGCAKCFFLNLEKVMKLTLLTN